MSDPLQIPAVLDVRRTFGFLRMGLYDPTCSVDDTMFVKTFMLDATTAVRHTIHSLGGVVELSTTGDPNGTAAWEAWLPIVDGHDSFTPPREQLRLRRLVHALPGLRFVRVPWLFDLACGIVLQQRVTYEEAIRQYQGLVGRYGTVTAIGTAFPSAHALARLTPAHLQALGIDLRRATTLVRIAHAHARDRVFDLPREELAARLLALPGIGAWTVGMLLAFGAGDEDAVPVGDLHLPRLVGQALANERRSDDARMLELLAPYAGHRARVIRLILGAKLHAPALLR